MDYDYILRLMRKGVVFREYEGVLVYADPKGLSQKYNRVIASELSSIYRDHFYQESGLYYVLAKIRSIKAAVRYSVGIFSALLHRRSI